MSVEDQAQKTELQDWERINAPRPTAPTFKPEDPGYGPPECDECDDPMPDLRRANGWRLCTACKSRIERERSRR